MDLNNNVGKLNKTMGVDRRHFLKVGGIFASGVMLSANAWAANGLLDNAAANITGTYLTPFFLLQKAATLGMGSDFIGADIQYGIQQDMDYIRPGNAFYMGIGMPFGLDQMVDALVKLKGKIGNGGVKISEAQRFAVILGGITYKAVMTELKRGDVEYKALGISETEKCLYQDVALISTFLSKGKDTTVKDATDISDLFKEMTPRTFTRFHTIMPDEEMGVDWVLRIQEWRGNIDDYYNRLAMAIVAPDTAKYEKIVNTSGFMKDSQMILNKVATFSRVEWLSRKDAEELINGANSMAAMALANGYKSIIAVSDFWENNIDETQLRSRLNQK